MNVYDFDGNPKKKEVYERGFKVFKKLYKSNKNSFKTINS